MEALQTMNISSILAWRVFWMLRGPQRAPKARPKTLVEASWVLLGSSLGLPWSLFGAPTAFRASKYDVKKLFDANLSTTGLRSSKNHFPTSFRSSDQSLGMTIWLLIMTSQPLGMTSQPLRYDQPASLVCPASSLGMNTQSLRYDQPTLGYDQPAP